MSLLDRFIGPGGSASAVLRQRAKLGGSEPLVAPRRRFTASAFAALETDPPQAADAAYEVFLRHQLTPGTAEREVARLLAGCGLHCPVVEESAAFQWDAARETNEAGQLRAFARHLVRMQLIHEANARELQRLRETREAGRVRLLPGCCPVCDAVARRSYRLADAPPLPVAGCIRHGGCNCAWVPK